MTTEVEFTRMSTKGQIVIPKKLPGIKEFEFLAEKGKKIARERGIKETDVDKIVHKCRKVQD